MNNKELLDNIDLMISEIEWEYPIDYAATFDEIKNVIKHNEKLECAVDKLYAILQDIEKDSCCYCPFHEKFCVDPEEKGSGYCKKEKWKEWSLEKEK